MLSIYLQDTQMFSGESIPADYYTEEDAEKCISYAESILEKVKKFMKN